jgi:hypothetical protein
MACQQAGLCLGLCETWGCQLLLRREMHKRAGLMLYGKVSGRLGRGCEMRKKVFAGRLTIFKLLSARSMGLDAGGKWPNSPNRSARCFLTARVC